MRRKAIAALLLALALLLTACAGGDITSEQVHLFYAARTETARGGDAITSIKARIPGWADMTTNERAEQVLERLLSGAAQGVGSPIPEGTELLGCEVVGGTASVDFSAPYGELSGMALTIADYCVTLSLTQIPGIYAVRITVDGEELPHRDTQIFRPSDVLLSSEEDVVRSLDVVLYFPEASSQQLLARQKTLTLSEGESAMGVLMEALQAGPEEDGLLPLLPDGFHVLTVRLAEDGVCHLNLPAADLELLPEGESAQLRMFRGIVRSLCSLDEVTSVQVLVDGEMRTSFGAVDISQPLSP